MKTLKDLGRYSSESDYDNEPIKSDDGSFVYFEEVEDLIRDRIKELDKIQKEQVELFGGIDAVIDGGKTELERLLGDEK